MQAIPVIQIGAIFAAKVDYSDWVVAIRFAQINQLIGLVKNSRVILPIQVDGAIRGPGLPNDFHSLLAPLFRRYRCLCEKHHQGI